MIFRYYIVAFFTGLLLLLGSPAEIFSQPNTEEQLAAQYFNEKEFEKAAVLYERLFNKSHKSGKLSGDAFYYYSGYIKCLAELKEYSQAQKLVKKLVKQYPENLTLIVDLGALYIDKGENEKGEEQYESAIKKMTGDHQQVIELAKAFIAHDAPNFAAQAYLRGRKISNNVFTYNFELAETYIALGKTDLVLEEYLNALELGSVYQQNVQNSLHTFLNDGTNERTELLKSKLLKRIQKSPGKTVYSEMLIWYYIENNQFNSALIQSKALDKRLNEDGSRIISLAELCKNNRDYKTAAKCYDYVISKGQQNFYYIPCRIDLLDVLNKQITTTGEYTEEDLLSLELKYTQTIEELGKYSETAKLFKELAHLKALYMGKIDEAIALLEEIIQLPGIEKNMLALCKIELGDIYLISGDMWESALYYGQVDKALKHDVLGHEAKFRNAKLSYYKGDFTWAQAQLDVLKAATSKLIANDALQLSLVITDNIGLDTTTAPLLMFAQADLSIFRNELDKAMATLDSINIIWPNHFSLSDDVIFKKAEIRYKQGNHNEAAALYQSLLDQYSYDILADDALFRLAEINDHIFKDKEKAMELYKEILLLHSGSVYVTEARKRFRQLRGDKLNQDDVFNN